MAYSNIASFLPAYTAKAPHQLAVVCPFGRDASDRVAYTHYTFSQLSWESDLLAAGLKKIGVKRGMRTVLMMKPSLEFFALTFALFKVGAVPVLIDPGMGLRNLKTCMQEANPDAFIGISKAHIARILLGWPHMKFLITAGGLRFWGGYSLEEIRSIAPPPAMPKPASTSLDEMAAILFTSGSTGSPKGAVYTHGTFIAQVTLLKELYAIKPGEVDLATFPLFALFGPALGMTVIIPDMDPTRPAQASPIKLIEAIRNFGVTNMFGSPALLDTLGRYGLKHHIYLPSLKRVISAGAPVHAAIMKRLTRMINPKSQVFTPYGATESLPVCNIGSHEILGETASKTDEGAGVCIGRPVDTIELRIIKITDDPIEMWSEQLLVPDGEIGEIVVRGPVVTQTYFNRSQATLYAKIKDANDETLWHRIGDLGYSDKKGRIWFCGRKSHRVVTEQGVMFTIPCEGVFNRHARVFRSALVGLPIQNSPYQKPVLCVELEKNVETDTEKCRQELLALGASFQHTKPIRSVLFRENFPVDIRHNAKIFREKLAKWAEKKLRRSNKLS